MPIYTLIVHPSIKSYADLKGKRLADDGADGPAELYSQRGCWPPTGSRRVIMK